MSQSVEYAIHLDGEQVVLKHDATFLWVFPRGTWSIYLDGVAPHHRYALTQAISSHKLTVPVPTRTMEQTVGDLVHLSEYTIAKWNIVKKSNHCDVTIYLQAPER